MNKRNYQKELDELIESLDGVAAKPTLLLHCCCAPCSSYVTEYLHKYFSLTLYFYNPNITETDEYNKRKEELKRYICEVSWGCEVEFMDADYDPERFIEVSRGYENEPERGKRCERCFELRLSKTAQAAVEGGFEYFCTTLSISPMKNADMLMSIGERLADETGVRYLPSDFKKKEGYKRSIELSREYDLYRQDFCGCVFSKKSKNSKKFS